MRRWPEERDAFQEAQEQRRIAQRCQRAADIGHQKDEEDDGVYLVPAIFVGAQQRPDQQHRGARGSHPTRQHGTEQQDRRIDDRRADQPSGQAHAARHGEQRQQQNDKRDVFQQQHVNHFEHGERQAVDRQKRDQKRRCPKRRNLAEMMVPEFGSKQREQRNRQQDADERHNPDQV